MKKFILIATTFCLSLSAADLTGGWNGKGGIESAKYGSVPQTAKMTLVQDGASLTGTFRLGNGPIMQITSGSVSGNQISFIVGQGLSTAVLTQNGATLQGKMTTSKAAVIDLVFSRQ